MIRHTTRRLGATHHFTRCLLMLFACSCCFGRRISKKRRVYKIRARLYKIKIMAPFFFSKFEDGGATCLQPPKFELQIPRMGRVYKIRARLYKIVQNVNKIMAPFFFFEIRRWWGYVPPAPQIWIANTGEGEGVQNLSSIVQNCTKLWHHFYFEIRKWWGLECGLLVLKYFHPFTLEIRTLSWIRVSETHFRPHLWNTQGSRVSPREMSFSWILLLTYKRKKFRRTAGSNHEFIPTKVNL